MNTPFKNIAANFGNRVWGLISLYLFTPVYTHLLGMESYGIVSFYTTIFGVVSFADAGISSAINREFAKSATDDYKLGLLKIFERIYAGICLLIGLCIYCMADKIATSWLHTRNIPIADIAFNIRLIGIGVALQLAASIYLGALMGLQKQVTANGLQTLWGFIRTVGVAIALYLISRSLTLFFTWTILCNLCLIIHLRTSVMRSLQATQHAGSLRVRDLDKTIWKYLGGMIIIAILSALNMQMDKIVVSKFFFLEELAVYSITSLLAQTPFIVATAVAMAIFPMMTRAISEHNANDLFSIYKKYSFLISIIILPICMILICYGKEIFAIWMSKKQLSYNVPVGEAGNLLIYLSIGNTLMSLQLMPYYLLLARGITKYNMIQGLIQLLFVVPALYYFIGKFGLSGVGIPWMIINVEVFCFLLFVVYKKELSGNIGKLLLSSILMPVVLNIFIGALIFYLCNFLPGGLFVFIYCALLFGVSVILNIFVYNKLNTTDRFNIDIFSTKRK